MWEQNLDRVSRGTSLIVDQQIFMKHIQKGCKSIWTGRCTLYVPGLLNP